MSRAAADFDAEMESEDPAGNPEDRLEGFLRRIEAISDDIASLQTDRRDVFAEMKNEGFNVTIVREILKLRKMDPSDVEERDELLDLYRNALRL